ncbi:hypothetical protein ASG93_01235 [Paenibacillus sp. Soil787]|nr:hypothetical protein ASG93_01235 [Paenibacillus sp. Soil787]
MVSGNLAPSFPSSVVKLRLITCNLLLFTLLDAYSRTCRTVSDKPLRKDTSIPNANMKKMTVSFKFELIGKSATPTIIMRRNKNF